MIKLVILVTLGFVALASTEDKVEDAVGSERFLIAGATRTVTSYSVITSIISTLGVRYCYKTIGTYATFSVTTSTLGTYSSNGYCRKRRWMMENPIDLLALGAASKPQEVFASKAVESREAESDKHTVEKASPIESSFSEAAEGVVPAEVADGRLILTYITTLASTLTSISYSTTAFTTSSVLVACIPPNGLGVTAC